jgi:hypothetical protein
VSLGAALLTLLLLAAVIVIVTWPLRSAGSPSRRPAARGADDGHGASGKEGVPAAPDGAALEAAREAKYRDLREAELDFRTGKLSAADYEAVRGKLRVEALEILNELEAIGEGSDLQQRERVREQQAGEDDRPAVEVALDHRSATERPGAAADAEGARESRVLAGVHQHEQDQDHADSDLQD